MAYCWLKILESTRLTDRTKENDAEIKDWRTLAIGFLIDFQVDDPWVVRVDAFPFLYELMNASFNWTAPKDIMVLMGEGWTLYGLQNNNGYDIRIEGDCAPNTKFERHLSVSDASLFISLKIGEIVSSLEAIDVDVEDILERFPQHLYQRGISS